MLNFFSNFGIKNEIKEHQDEIDALAKALAVATYLDLEIKDIEILSSKMLIDKFISHMKIEDNKISKLHDYIVGVYFNYLERFKKDLSFFKSTKNWLIKDICLNENSDEALFIKKIIESDNIVTPDESNFLSKLKRILKDENRKKEYE